jgi:hypothetical protein
MLFLNFQRVSLSHFVSFTENRLPRTQIIQWFSEMEHVGYIKKSVLRDWKALMNQHNNLLIRGRIMRLVHGRTFRYMKCSSLDHFMLQMQSGYLAKLLNDICRFGERVVERMGEESPDLFWIVDDQMMVERSNWLQLCRQVMNILHIIGFQEKDFGPFRFKPWPDRDVLRAAAARCRCLFGRFATADVTGPSIPQRILLQRLHTQAAVTAASADDQATSPGPHPWLSFADAVPGKRTGDRRRLRDAAAAAARRASPACYDAASPICQSPACCEAAAAAADVLSDICAPPHHPVPPGAELWQGLEGNLPFPSESAGGPRQAAAYARCRAAKGDTSAAISRVASASEDGKWRTGPVASCYSLPSAESGPWAGGAAGDGDGVGTEASAWMVGPAATRGAVAWGGVAGRRPRGAPAPGGPHGLRRGAR